MKDLDYSENKIIATKKIADFFEAELERDENNKLALIGLAHAAASFYTMSAEVFDGENETLEKEIMIYKKKSMDTFEKLAEAFPAYSQSHFHLAYFYVNLGLYKKAVLSFEEFLSKVNDDEDFSAGIKTGGSSDISKRKMGMVLEAKKRIRDLEAPVEIEEAENKIRTGNFNDAKPVIEKYIGEEAYKKHWPLYLDLGIIYDELYMEEEAIKILEEGLKINPHSKEMINLLIEIYRNVDDQDMVLKYQKKLELIDKEV